ncbi:MAG TPA: cell division protein FtsZ [Victivallales bacterium]|nr:cell division protein FtsZ [Victivallales bacterium]
MTKMTDDKNITDIPVDDEIDVVKVIGLGKAGVKIVSTLSKQQETKWLDIAAVDTDSSTISKSNLKNKFLIGEEWTKGLGCGGNIIKGERALAHKSNIKLKQFIDDASLIIVACGFGGGTATGGTPVLARFAKEKNIPIVFVVTLPFAFEGHSKREMAENQVHHMVRTSTTIITIPNDLLYSSLPASTPFEQAFSKANEEVAKAILGISELLRCNNLISVDLCDLHNILCRQKSECGIGIGTANIEDGNCRIKLALKDLLESPLLGGQQRINDSDAMIVTLTGGSDLTISEMKYALNNITRMASDKTEIVVGANTDETYTDKAQITVIPIIFDKTAEPVEEALTTVVRKDKTIHPALFKDIFSPADKSIHQPDLPFANQSRGIFTSTTPTLFNGEDLDIPTFQRRGIHLDKGK